MAASNFTQLHFVFIPLMSPGHLMPIVDMARLFAHHGMIVTLISTPLNSKRFKSIIDRAVDSGLQIRLVDLDFPAAEAGLPEGCENMDSISRDLIKNFFAASQMLQKPIELLFEKLSPRPNCIVSGLPMIRATALVASEKTESVSTPSKFTFVDIYRQGIFKL